jgi:transcriptional regulator
MTRHHRSSRVYCAPSSEWNLVITLVEAKFKLSQNRPDADIDGVISGLITDGHQDTADAMRRARTA